jgi:Protein of unknown function (DUF551)
MADWIACTERLPPPEEWVLVWYVAEAEVRRAEYHDLYEATPWVIEDACQEVLFAPAADVSHWMPLPEPPAP